MKVTFHRNDYFIKKIMIFILNEKIEDSYWAAIQKNRKGRGRNAEPDPVDPGGMKSKFCKNS